MELKVDQIAEHLTKLKAEQGEDAYLMALTGFAKNLLSQGNTAPFIHSLLGKLQETLDLEALQKEADELRRQREKAQDEAHEVLRSKDLQQTMIQTMQAQMPNLKTQAQFDLVVRVFEAVQFYFNAAFGQDTQAAASARDALNQGLDLAPKLAVIAEEAAASPEVPTNPNFTAPPQQFTEHATYERLLAELEELTSAEKLTQWYQTNKPAMDSIVSNTLRNTLFDRIRALKGRF